MIGLILLVQVVWERTPEAAKGFIIAILAFSLYFALLRFFGIDDHPVTEQIQ